MLKFKTACAVLAYLSSNLLNEVGLGLSLFRYFKVGLRVCDIVVKKFTFAILSPDEFLYKLNIGLLFTVQLNIRWLIHRINKESRPFGLARHYFNCPGNCCWLYYAMLRYFGTFHL